MPSDTLDHVKELLQQRLDENKAERDQLQAALRELRPPRKPRSDKGKPRKKAAKK